MSTASLSDVPRGDFFCRPFAPFSPLSGILRSAWGPFPHRRQTSNHQPSAAQPTRRFVVWIAALSWSVASVICSCISATTSRSDTDANWIDSGRTDNGFCSGELKSRGAGEAPTGKCTDWKRHWKNELSVSAFYALVFQDSAISDCERRGPRGRHGSNWPHSPHSEVCFPPQVVQRNEAGLTGKESEFAVSTYMKRMPVRSARLSASL